MKRLMTVLVALVATAVPAMSMFAMVPADRVDEVPVERLLENLERNAQNLYSINSVTAKKGDNGLIEIQFGGCDGVTPNCIPISAGWNYLVRLYQARPEVLDGRWTFPQAIPVP